MNRMKTSNTPRLNRRSLLASLAALCGLGALRWKTVATEPIATHHTLALRVLKVLGLASTTLPVSREDVGPSLAALFGVEQSSLPSLENVSDDALRDRLRERRLDDYAAGRLVSTAGWWLAQTEAQAVTLALKLYGNRALPACYAVTAWQELQQSHG